MFYCTTRIYIRSMDYISKLRLTIKHCSYKKSSLSMMNVYLFKIYTLNVSHDEIILKIFFSFKNSLFF